MVKKMYKIVIEHENGKNVTIAKTTNGTVARKIVVALCKEFDDAYENNTQYIGLLTEGCNICVLDKFHEGCFYTGDNNWEEY